jgi:TonB family protein
MKKPQQPHWMNVRETLAGSLSGVVELHDAAFRWRAPAGGADATSNADLDNVVPFDRARRDHRGGQRAPEILVERTTSPAVADWTRAHWPLLLAISIALHAALYLPFRRDPAPMASIGLETIAVELVLGANEDAGVSRARGRANLNLPPPTQALDVSEQPQELAETPTDVATLDTPQDATPEHPPAEAGAPTTPDQQAKADTPDTQPTPEQTPTATPEQSPSESSAEAAPKPVAPVQPMQTAERPGVIQMIPESATGEVQTSAQPTLSVTAVEIERPGDPPTIAAKPPREAAARAETPKAQKRREAEQRQAERREATRRDSERRRVERREAVQREADRRKQQREARLAAVRGEANPSTSVAPASTAAGGVGRGRSDSNTNYRGLVAAHLARYKQFPPEARSRGDNGRATVNFSLSASGSVTSVRLVNGTGLGALDQEAVAMVRRASPFPAPPDGRAANFTVPVTFQLR